MSRRIFHGDAPPPPVAPSQTLFNLREQLQQLQRQNAHLQQTIGLSSGLRQRFEHLYDASPLGLLTHDADECIVEANETLARLLGMDRRQLVGQHIGRFIAAQDHAHFIQHLNLLRDGMSGSQRRCTLTLTSAQQTQIKVQMECTLYLTNPYGTKLIHSSIQPLADNDLGLSPPQQDELAHKARLSTLGEMTAGLAHELSQPLTAIHSYAKSCLRLIQSGTDTQAQVPAILEEMCTQSERARRIISHLRDFSSNHASHREATDLDKVVQLAVDMLHNEFRENNIRVEIKRQAQLPTVNADAIQLEQVLINLLRNAAEAMQDRPADQRHLHITLEQTPDTRQRITVSDTGTGIAAEHAHKLTTPFYTTKETGMGLGLAISRSIVESHGGSLSYENNPHGGATFVVTLAVDGKPTSSAD